TPFNVATGALHHFAWSAVTSPQSVNTPFSATVTAKDAGNNTVTGFTGTAALNCGTSACSVGTGTTSSTTFPLNTYCEGERSQCIYLQSEIGSAGTIRSLALNVSTPPGQTLNNWTLRMKHTSPSNDATAAWESTGWTTVYQSNQTISTTGLATFTFTTSFVYDGVSNLMVDFSFNNSSYTSNGAVLCTTASSTRSIFACTDSGYGDPLTWAGTSPTPSTSTALPNLQLVMDRTVPMTPAETGAFVNGIWTGSMVVQQAATGINLQADDGAGHTGDSTAFDVQSLGALTLGLAANATEGDAPVTASLSVPAAVAADLMVNLSSSDTTEATVPATVTIPAGQSSVTFPVDIVDDALLDGPQVTALTASVPAYDNGLASITVNDNENTNLTLTLPASVSEGGSGTGSVSISGTLTSALTVSLASNTTARLTVPAAVSIPAGATSATFTLDAPDNALTDGTQSVTITASASGFTSGSSTTSVLDDEVVLVPEIAVEQPVGTDLTDGSASVGFGGVPLGSALTKTLTVKSSGTGDLTGLAVTTDGSHAADFTVSALGTTTLAPGASTTLCVTFAPGGGGWHPAALRLASNDADENPFDIALSGLGYTPDEFASAGGLTIPASGLSGEASPYPSTIAVSGVMGGVSALRVKLNGVSHTYPADLDLFLVSPSGRVCALMSDAGGSFPLTNLDLAFADAAASAIPAASAITAGSYRPANYEPGEALPPGGIGLIGTNLLALVAEDVNGIWKLFACEGHPDRDGGSITSWSLVFEQNFTDDHGDGFATATPLPAPITNSATGVIAPGDEDFFRVTVPGPGILIAWSEGATDTYGHLYGNDRTLLDEDDNNDLQANFRVSAGVVAGDYYLRVKGSSSNTAGTYTLRTRFIPETEPIQVSYLEKAGNDVNLGFTGSALVLYYIQGSEDLQDWELLATMTGTGAENYTTLPGQGLQPKRYFRVSTQPPVPAGFTLIPAGIFQGMPMNCRSTRYR
ncbi:MAG: choice-of-anchor D domain-containing protein, partial [Verrucomicrobia bacterium]|nr:choice-of-anchor D domain-containing protein [Verrucomicrobiota bacterium]